MAKRYLYKVYQDNAPAGVLKNVISDFTYTQDINNPPGELVITLGSSLDDSAVTAESDTLVDELGNFVVDEFDNNIIGNKSFSFDDIPLNLGNRVEVVMFDENYVNGTTVFDGLISRWSTDYVENTISISVLPWGAKLDDFLIAVLPDTIVESFEEPIDDYERAYSQVGKGASLNPYQLAQTFQVSNTSDISSMAVYGYTQNGGQVNTTFTLHQGDPASGLSAPLTSVNRVVEEILPTWFTYTFPAEVSLTASTTYTWTITHNGIDALSDLFLGQSVLGGYADGDSYDFDDNGWSAAKTPDLVFQAITDGGNLGSNFNSKDPSSIMRDLVDNQISLGGTVSYDDASIDDTNTIVSYSFKFNTIREGVEKVLQLAPSNWFWYVDAGTNLLHFHERSTAADHTFIKGKHLENLNLEYSLENVVNKSVFSGGDDGTGDNILDIQVNSDSIGRYGQWLRKVSDNRVTNAETAATLNQNYLNSNGMPTFHTKISVLATEYNIETIKLGDRVEFRNFNDFIDSISLVVSSIKPSPDKIDIELDTIPPYQTKRIEDIRRNLDALQTIDNPDLTS